MAESRETQTSPWINYGVTVMLGLAFSVTLFSIAWNNAIDSNKKEFELESLSRENAIFGKIQSAHNEVNSLAAFLMATPGLAEQDFAEIAHQLLQQHEFIGGVDFCPAVKFDAGDMCENAYKVMRDGVAKGTSPLFGDPHFRNAFTLLRDTTEVVTATVPSPTGGAKAFWLLRAFPTGSPGQRAVVALFVDVDSLVMPSSVSTRFSMVMYNDSASLSGRKLLFNSPPAAERDGWAVTNLSQEGISQFPLFSIKLSIARDVGWGEIQKNLVYISLLIGLGVTLLLVALVRSKEQQARELRERNIVISHKVEEQTHELARARDQALDASRAKSDFLASMSHEIRTPLNAITGMAELLSETKLTEEQWRYLDVFRKAGDTLLSLVNDILDLSKIEAKQLVLEHIEFDLVEAVENSTEIYALKAAGKGIELLSRVDPDVAPMRKGDPARLRQIILNLISNALKFTERGEIELRVSNANGRGADFLTFAVRDTGIGIPPDKLEAIFSSFTQVDSSTTRKYGGTGLGLTICRSLAEMMNGEIHVESRVGEGSRFVLTIQMPVNGHAKPEHVANGLAGSRILVIDDNDASREILRCYLEWAGAVPAEAASAEQALALCRDAREETNFDAVIVDFRMPGMDGLAFARAAHEAGCTGRFVLMLGAADLNQIQGSLSDAGIDAYLVKPVKRAELLREAARPGDGTGAEPVAAGRAADDAAQKPLRILLVEDNPDNRLLINAYVRSLPYEIVEAENGQIAVDEFQKDKFDLILMDVQMPVMDGHEATRTIRTIEREKGLEATPIIALTAHAIKEEIDKCLNAGCDMHLGKPIKKAVLLGTIQSLMQERQAARPG